jgi:cytochrome c oxidase subunit IV
MATPAHHGPTIGVYVAVFAALLVGTAGTVAAAFVDLGLFNNVVMLGIAITKATLVVLFFMGVRHNTPLTKTVVIAGFCWLFILFGLGMSDYLTRPWIGVPGR